MRLDKTRAQGGHAFFPLLEGSDLLETLCRLLTHTTIPLTCKQRPFHAFAGQGHRMTRPHPPSAISRQSCWLFLASFQEVSIRIISLPSLRFLVIDSSMNFNCLNQQSFSQAGAVRTSTVGSATKRSEAQEWFPAPTFGRLCGSVGRS